MPQTNTIILGDGKLPLDAEAGDLDSGGERTAFNFEFVYRGIPVKGHLAPAEGIASQLTLSGLVGPLPFSAEGPQARIHLVTIIEAANAAVGPFLRVVAGEIVLTVSAPLSEPLSAVSAVSLVCRLLVPLKPYLDCIGIYLRSPAEAAAAGGAALRSEYRRSSGTKAKGRTPASTAKALVRLPHHKG